MSLYLSSQHRLERIITVSHFTDKASLLIAYPIAVPPFPHCKKVDFVWVFIIPYSGKLAPSLASGCKPSLVYINENSISLSNDWFRQSCGPFLPSCELTRVAQNCPSVSTGSTESQKTLVLCRRGCLVTLPATETSEDFYRDVEWRWGCIWKTSSLLRIHDKNIRGRTHLSLLDVCFCVLCTLRATEAILWPWEEIATWWRNGKHLSPWGHCCAGSA